MVVIGDIHGQYVKMLTVLHDARLIDAAGHWSGGATTLWFMGDYFDRGPDGIAAIDLIRALQD
ncbi:MAG TPA: metallophosphoesterase, partial [Promineifilum sp.]|nr:metallophosphoesterase [Promineifilum sp.]